MTVWITGASSGLGRAVALRLAASGRRVAATARTLPALGEIAKLAGGQVTPLAGDTTDREAIERLVASVEEGLGPINLAILNAGTHTPMSAHDFDAEAFAALVGVNLVGTANCLGALLPRMLGRGRGHIAVVASVAGYRGLPTAAAYGATKAALINMTESLKPELEAAGIKLQLVNPGFVRTPLTDKNNFAMPALMEPDEAAEALIRGLESSAFEITFPKRFTRLVGFARMLPYRLYFPLTRRLVQE